MLVKSSYVPSGVVKSMTSVVRAEHLVDLKSCPLNAEVRNQNLYYLVSLLSSCYAGVLCSMIIVYIITLLVFAVIL